MKVNKILLFLTPFLLLASLLLAACQPSTTPEEVVTLRMAVLPILDAVPMYVAQKEGLFEAHGVKVEFINVQSAPERDQLIAAGQADGMINEALSVAFYNRDATQVQIVRYARAATSEIPLFSILVSKDSGVEDLDDLKGVEIGISQGTIIEYLTDRLLQAEGFNPDEIKTVAVPKIPDRMALLQSGELKAGMLPEPPTSLAVMQGARVILDDSRHPEFSFSVISFRKEVIDQHPKTIRAFLAALEEAVERINQDPSQWVNFLVELEMIPPPLAGSFQVPAYVTASVPTRAQWEDVIAWAKEKGLLDEDVSYEESVTDDFLPK